MVAKACAVLLVLLIVLPFTAPFTTCDPADAAPIGANQRGTIAQNLAGDVIGEAIVATDRAIAIRRLELAVLDNSICGDASVRCAVRPVQTFAFTPLPLHDRPLPILRI
jgi:hypothetical protein